MADTLGSTAMVRLAVKVLPGASRSEITGWLGERLKSRINAVAEKGRANTAVEALIAKGLGLAASQVRIVAGKTSTCKTLEITGLQATDIMQRLGRTGHE